MFRIDLDDICLKMSKDTSYLCFCVRGLELAYAALFFCMQVYS